MSVYRIEPLTPAVLPHPGPRRASVPVRNGSVEIVAGVAAYFIVVAVGAAIAIRRFAPDDVSLVALLSILIAVLAAVAAGALMRTALRPYRQKRAAAEEQALQREYDREYRLQLRDARTEAEQRARAEAETRTQEAQALLEYIRDLQGQCNANLQRATTQIALADDEFRATAYAPFWDAVETAALNLDSVTSDLRSLRANAGSYFSLLRGRRHNFPLSVVDHKALPQPSESLRQFRSLVRMGQTDISFATIWEHRRTREVLIAGFRTLAEGIANIETSVLTAVRELSNALDEQSVALREEANEMSKDVASIHTIQQESLELQREAAEARHRRDRLGSP